MTCSGMYYDLMAISYYTKVRNRNKWQNKNKTDGRSVKESPTHIETDHQKGN